MHKCTSIAVSQVVCDISSWCSEALPFSLRLRLQHCARALLVSSGTDTFSPSSTLRQANCEMIWEGGVGGKLWTRCIVVM